MIFDSLQENYSHLCTKNPVRLWYPTFIKKCHYSNSERVPQERTESKIGLCSSYMHLFEYPIGSWISRSRVTKCLLSKDLLCILQAIWLHIIHQVISTPCPHFSRVTICSKAYTKPSQIHKYLCSCKSGHISGNCFFQPNGPGFENTFVNVVNVFFIFMALFYLWLYWLSYITLHICIYTFTHFAHIYLKRWLHM